MKKDEALRILREKREMCVWQLRVRDEYAADDWVPRVEAELDALDMAIKAVELQPDYTNAQTLFIKTKFPSLNEVIDVARGNKRESAALKKAFTELVGWECKAQRIKPVKRAQFTFIWTEINQLRNMDNIASAKKFIFDGLQAAGILKNDGWKQVDDFRDQFCVGSEYSVEVIISEVK